MKFSYRLKIHRTNGQIESSIQDFSGSIQILGRGGSSTIIIPDKSLALEHVKFELEEDRLFATPLSKKDPVLCNSEVIDLRRNLAPGDKLKVGMHTFEIIHEQSWGLREERFEEAKKKSENSSENQISEIISSVDLDSKLPSILNLSLTAIILISALFIVMPLLGHSKSSLSSGQISNHHGMLATKCAACHTQAFARVKDSACLSCHNMSEHSERLTELLKVKNSLRESCTDCHFEHRSNHGLIINDSRQCSNCHAGLNGIDSQTHSPNVANFDTHPEFSVSLPLSAQSDDGRELVEPQFKRIKLDNQGELVDPTHLKLNHKIHLKEGIEGPDGRTTLYCKDCHKLSTNFRTIEPMSFDKYCRSCHRLEFDERLPGIQVPHSKPDVVYNFIYAEFAKLALGIKNRDTTEDGPERIRPGQVNEPEVKSEFARKYIETETRAAERTLFTRTACYLCHDITERSSATDEPATSSLSRFKVLAPKMPARWLPASTFSHGAHEEASCESCHALVRESTKTQDVLLPGIATCRNCHADQSIHPKVKSDCTMCHSYHDSLEMPADKKRTIKEIISTLP